MAAVMVAVMVLIKSMTSALFVMLATKTPHFPHMVVASMVLMCYKMTNTLHHYHPKKQLLQQPWIS